MNENVELGFDKFYTSDINECMSSVLGLNETKDDIATIIKYRGQRFLEAKDKARFERNHVFLLENDPGMAIDLYCSEIKDSKYKYLIEECTSVIFDDDKVQRCVKRRDQLATHKGIEKDSILAYVFAVRIHPPMQDAVIQFSTSNGIKLRISGEIDISTYQSVLQSLRS